MQYLGPTGYYWVTGKKYRFELDKDKDVVFPCYIQSPKNRKTGQQSRINYPTAVCGFVSV